MQFWKLLKIFEGKNMHTIAVGQMNVESIRKKFDPFMGAAAGKIDILLINKTKISPYFPKANFIFMGTTNPTNMTIIP